MDYTKFGTKLQFNYDVNKSVALFAEQLCPWKAACSENLKLKTPDALFKLKEITD